MSKYLQRLFCLLILSLASMSAWAAVKNITVKQGESFIVSPYQDSGLPGDAVSTSCDMSQGGDAFIIDIRSTEYTSAGYYSIYRITALKLGEFELQFYVGTQDWPSLYDAVVIYKVTVEDNGGGLTQDYDICYYANGIHYHFNRNDDEANSVTLVHVINGAKDGHSHGYPSLDSSVAATSVSIPATFTSGSTNYTVTRIDGMFASSAVNSDYNAGLGKITTLTIPSSVSNVADRAFIKGMSSLKTINWNSAYCSCSGPIFPTTVTTIKFGSTAKRVPAYLTANTSVASLTVPETIMQVASHAFSGTKLKTLVFNLTKASVINLKAFAQYSGTPGTDNFAVKDNNTLTTLTWNCPEYTFSYGNPLSYDNGNPLDYLKALDKLIIGDVITDVDGHLFHNLPITSVTIPEGVTTIGDWAFMGCSKLATLNWNSKYCTCTAPVFPESVTKITFGSTAKRVPAYITANTSVASLTVPETIMQVGSHAFSGTKLKTVVFNPTKASVINLKAFAQYSGTPGTDNFAVKDNNTLTTLTWNCPEYTFSYGNPLSYDNGNPLDYLKALDKLIIGDVITDVDGQLFHNLPITTVTIPEGVTTIGDWAFMGCSKLATVNWNSKYCTCTAPVFPESVTKITFGSTAKRVPAYLTACTNVESLTVPTTIMQVGSHAFSGSKLKTVVFNPTKASVINLKAFAQYSGTPGTNNFAVKDNNTLTTLTWNCPEFTFSYNNPLSYDNGKPLDYLKDLDKLVIGDAITDVPDQLFSNLPMKKVVFSKNNTSIGKRSFEGCTNLTGMLEFPEGLVTINERAFAGCSSLVGPLIMSKIKTVGASAFEGCTGFSSVHISGKLQSIGKNAFLGTHGYCYIGYTSHSLKGAGLNPSVIYCIAPNPPECDAATFVADCDKTTVPLWVQQSLVSAFSSATVWKDFSNLNGANLNTPSWEAPETYELKVGQSEAYPYTPASATDFKPAFYSTDTTIVRVDENGMMTGVTPGEAIVVMTYCDIPHYCNVIVGGTATPHGDLDGNGQVDVSDVDIIIDMVLGKKPQDLATADLDGNGMVDVSDVNALIDIILGK